MQPCTQGAPGRSKHREERHLKKQMHGSVTGPKTVLKGIPGKAKRTEESIELAKGPANTKKKQIVILSLNNDSRRHDSEKVEGTKS